MCAKQFYLTTAIDYANGKPHLGHAYEKVLSDVIIRTRRLRGEDAYFLTGLDEHGQKVQQSAQRQGTTPQAMCDAMAQQFQGLCKQLNLSNDDYIRTTEPRHKAVVCQILQDLFDRGLIYKAEYTGYYSTRAEQFLQEKDRNEDGNWPEIYGEVSEITESNYFFKLSQYRDWLVEHIESHPEFIYPQFRAKQVLEFLKEGINDLCISRPKSRLEWGIELPFDSEYVSYVWFDALLNYVSAVGYGTDDFGKYWPADVHVIGKDILAPPHAVYWPIMLKAMEVELPKTILAHGWWMSGGAKMSKSTGNVVDPLALLEQYGADAFRYFLMREMKVGQDGDFTLERFQNRYNADLANDLGNLANRIHNMVTRYCGGVIPEAAVKEGAESELQELWKDTSGAFVDLCASYQFHTALERLFGFVKAINRYAEQRAPWKLAKSDAPEDQAMVASTLATMATGLYLAGQLLSAVMPETAAKIQVLLGAEPVDQWPEVLPWSDALAGKQLGERTILFPRIEIEAPSAS